MSRDPKKVKAIREMDLPNNKMGERRFMDMVNYLSKFCPNLAKLSVPIYSVVGAKCECLGDVDQQKAFDLTKKELSSSPVLTTFDPSKRHRVSADASQSSPGACLLLENDPGDWQPVE